MADENTLAPVWTLATEAMALPTLVEDIKLFRTRPFKFKSDTPVGPLNPDLAIKKQEDDADRTYIIRETKSTLDDSTLRPTVLVKIKAAKNHFAAFGIIDYDRLAPEKWNF